MQSNTAIIVREINTNEESRCTTPITRQKMLRKSIKTRDVRKKGCFVQDGTATKTRQISELSSYKTLCQERTLLKRITQNCWVMTQISKLRTRDILMRGKILFALLATLRGQIFKNKIPFTPKCLRLKWLLRKTQWSHAKISLRTMGLGREGVGSSGLDFLNLSVQNVSLIRVGWQPRIPAYSIVSGKDFVYAL